MRPWRRTVNPPSRGRPRSFVRSFRARTHLFPRTTFSLHSSLENLYAHQGRLSSSVVKHGLYTISVQTFHQTGLSPSFSYLLYSFICVSLLMWAGGASRAHRQIFQIVGGGVVALSSIHLLTQSLILILLLFSLRYSTLLFSNYPFRRNRWPCLIWRRKRVVRVQEDGRRC